MSEQSSANQGQSVVTKILDFDLQRKHKLVEIYDDILQLADELKQEENILQELTTEFGNFRSEIPNSKEILLEEECPIIIAVIVDTPGIGTTANPELNARLFEFLPRAVAFIYIIDAGRAGGLEKDRLLAIFEALRNWRQRGKLIEFDVSRTVFVCNKWDAVEEEEEEVLNYITETLREHWPNFHEKQLFKLSVKEEKKLAKQEKISENYRTLLSGIDKMVPCSLEAKVVMNARWQQTFLTAMMDRTFGRIKLSRKCESVKQELIRTAEEKQHVLFSKMVEVEKKVITNAEDRCVELSKQVNLHLNNPETKDKLCQLRPGESFCESSYVTHIASIVKIKERGTEIIHYHIKNELELFMQNEHVENLENDLESMLLKEVQLFNEQSKELRKLILNYRVPAAGFKVVLKTIAIGTVVLITSPLWIPLTLTILARRVNQEDEIKLSYAEECLKINEFNSNPLRFMNEWCDGILLIYYSETEIYKRLDSKCVTPFKKKVQHVFSNVIHQQIKADDVFIRNVKNEIRSFKEMSKLYLPFGEKAKVIMGKLLIICMEYFSNDSVANTNVRSYLHAQKWEGRFAQVRAIEMLHGQKWVKAVVKTMKKPLNTDISFIQLTE
ncbi:unnamed protein product [Mytilus coruscus]|uniref:Uncharacterized protein n=1 Tax=Mytilus coruscus TaxID=42192 RepID=A0A6J8B097_MYTCO|nr:unnamed protein product [Mytilus coruscus]